MRYLLFGPEASSYRVAVLTKSTAFSKPALQEHYVQPLQDIGLAAQDIIGFTLKYDDNGKCSASFAKGYLANLLPTLASLQVKVLYVCDTTYFKILTKQTKADPHHGYVLPCALTGYEHLHVVLGINHQQLFYNPDLQTKLNTGLQAVGAWLDGAYVPPGTDVLRQVSYPQSVSDIQHALNQLSQLPMLSCDTETYSLKVYAAGIGTIAFATDEHSAIAFTVDVDRHDFEALMVRQLLRQFFEQYSGRILWYNACFDITILTYALWMTDLQDVSGMLLGIDHLCRTAEDVMLMTYLATNSCAGNELSLKVQAQEFAGNWAQSDITDITKISTPDLLRYNAVDVCSTWHVYHKHWPTVQADQQEEIYRTIFMPSVPVIVQMQCTGLPVNPAKVTEADIKLTAIRDEQQRIIAGSPLIQAFEQVLQQQAMELANSKLKTKQHPLSKFSGVRFNPASTTQVAQLLHEQLNLPVLDLTATKQPATGAKTLKKLRNNTQDPQILVLLDALIALAEVDILLNNFIQAFQAAHPKGDGRNYLFGSFKLGGTVSGRLSSANPNLQNIPSTGSKYAKIIKSCVEPPSGWLYVGADFNALEDHISALTTEDPSKLAIYLQGFDAHCRRAFSYWPSAMPDIRMAEDTERTFKIEQDGEIYYLMAGEVVTLPDGSQRKIEEVFGERNSRIP